MRAGVGSHVGPSSLVDLVDCLLYHRRMSIKDEGPIEELPPTALASLVAAAKETMVVKPDRHGPAAVRAMAAVVRDLKGMPDLSVTRESATRLRLARRGKVGFIVIDYDAAVLSMQVEVGGFSEPVAPGTPKSHRYALQGETWTQMAGGGDLFTDLKAHVVRLYPELAAKT